MFDSTTSVLDAPPPVEQDDQSSAGPDRKRLILIIAAVAGLAVLGAVAFLLLSGGGAEEDLGPVPSARGSAPAPVEEAPAEAVPGDVAPESFDSTAGRDPFEPVFEPVAPEPEPAPVSDTITPIDPADGTAGGSTTSTGTPVTIEMVAVDAATATLTVDGQQYTVAVGESFAGTFKLYGLFDARCAGVLYGDASVPLCEGDVKTVST